MMTQMKFCTSLYAYFFEILHKIKFRFTKKTSSTPVIENASVSEFDNPVEEEDYLLSLSINKEKNNNNK